MKKIPQQRDIKYHPKVKRLERCEMDQLAHVLSLVSAHRASLCSVEERRDSRDVEMGHNRSQAMTSSKKRAEVEFQITGLLQAGL